MLFKYKMLFHWRSVFVSTALLFIITTNVVNSRKSDREKSDKDNPEPYSNTSLASDDNKPAITSDLTTILYNEAESATLLEGLMTWGGVVDESERDPGSSTPTLVAPVTQSTLPSQQPSTHAIQTSDSIGEEKDEEVEEITSDSSSQKSNTKIENEEVEVQSVEGAPHNEPLIQDIPAESESLDNINTEEDNIYNRKDDSVSDTSLSDAVPEAQAYAPSSTMKICPGVCVAERISEFCEASLDISSLCKTQQKCCVSADLFASVDRPPKEFVILKGKKNPKEPHNKQSSSTEMTVPVHTTTSAPSTTTTTRTTTPKTPRTTTIIRIPPTPPQTRRPLPPSHGSLPPPPNRKQPPGEIIDPEKKCRGTCVAGFFAFLCDEIDRDGQCPRGGRCCVTQERPTRRPPPRHPPQRPQPNPRPTELQNKFQDDSITTSIPTPPSNVVTYMTTTTESMLEGLPCPGICIPEEFINVCKPPSTVMPTASECKQNSICCDNRAITTSTTKYSIFTKPTESPPLVHQPPREPPFRDSAPPPPPPFREPPPLPIHEPSPSSGVGALQTLASLFSRPSPSKPHRPIRPNRPPLRRPPPTTTTTTTTPVPTEPPDVRPDCVGSCIAPLLVFTCFGQAEMTDMFKCSNDKWSCCAPKSAIRDLIRQAEIMNIARNDTVWNSPPHETDLYDTQPQQPQHPSYNAQPPPYEQPYQQPSYDQYPGYQQPPYQHPPYERPNFEQPPYEQPPYEQPPYEQPPYEQPPYEQPPYEQPPYEQPPYEQPPYEQPPYEQPPYEQPQYEQPPYEEESFEQPAYISKPQEENLYQKPPYNPYDRPNPPYGPPPNHIGVTTQAPNRVTTKLSVSTNNVNKYVCGVKGDTPRTGRVVGGEDAAPGEWCWQVALINSLNQYLCGGALIGTQWVLTAAHCVTNIVRLGDAIYVRVGDHDLTTRYGSAGAQTLRVATTYIHHNHNSQTLDNDIALLKLSGHAELQEGVCLVCLPARGVGQDAGKRCTVTGYGYMGETGPIPLRVREAEVPVVSETSCVRKINAVTEQVFILPASSFCAGGESGHDACQGDGGGPLVCNVDGYYELSGLVSWGFGCGRQDVPGVYVKVSSFIGWINQIISVNNL